MLIGLTGQGTMQHMASVVDSIWTHFPLRCDRASSIKGTCITKLGDTT